MAPRDRETTYQRWMRQEGLPVVGGYGITAVSALELAPWQRLGGKGAFIQLDGMEGVTGLYMAEIPPGGALRPEKHLYDELIYILSGRGASEIWTGPSEPTNGPTTVFEWQSGSLFAPPLNAWHRLINGSGTEPVRFLAATGAPLIMDLFHSPELVFGCDYQFGDRYDGRADYFSVGEDRYLAGRMSIWETNFIPDVRLAQIDLQGAQQLGKRSTGYEMGGNVLVGHIEAWPPGLHDKAHHHSGGAIILIVAGRGYTLMWPREVGIQPYQAGNGDKVVRVDWQEGTVLSPPTGWFHQHFNSGSGPMRFVAFRYGSHNYETGFWRALAGKGVLVSIREGGTQIEYEDEDPEIQRQYLAELAAAGIESLVPILKA